MAGIGLIAVVCIVQFIIWASSGDRGVLGKVFPDSYVDSGGRVLHQNRRGLQSFTVMSPPISLKYAEAKQSPVFDGYIELPVDMIALFHEKDMLIAGYEANFVKLDYAGFEEVVGADEIYNHHFVMYISGQDEPSQASLDQKCGHSSYLSPCQALSTRQHPGDDLDGLDDLDWPC